MGCSKSSSKREVYNNTILPQETKKTLNRQPNFTPKTTGKRTTTKKPSKISRRKEIIKTKAEISETEMKETIVKINKTKSWFFETIKKKKRQASSLQPDSSRKHEKRIKATKLEMKKERLQQTMLYKGLQETIMNSYMAIKWITWKKWTDSQKSSIFQD